MQNNPNRRRFIQTAAATTNAGLWPSLSQEKSPKRPVNIACIGVGGKGSSDTDNAARNGQIVALCDIDDNQLKQKAKKYPNAKTFNDYRELLKVMGDKIDAVTVSTADHAHAAASSVSPAHIALG